LFEVNKKIVFFGCAMQEKRRKTGDLHGATRCAVFPVDVRRSQFMPPVRTLRAID
jgi:hypothetical protein